MDPTVFNGDKHKILKKKKSSWVVLLESDGAVGVFVNHPLRFKRLLLQPLSGSGMLFKRTARIPQGEILREDWHEGVISFFNLSRLTINTRVAHAHKSNE